MKEFSEIMDSVYGGANETKRNCNKHSIEFIRQQVEVRSVVGVDSKFVCSHAKISYIFTINYYDCYARNILEEIKHKSEE